MSERREAREATVHLVRAPSPESFVWDGRRLGYESYGTGDRLLVLLHGLLMDVRLNRGVARALARRGHRVVLLDLLGHGASDKPQHAAEYRLDVYAEQVVALLDHLGADRAVIGGLSLGANVSLEVAARHPGRVQALMIEMPVLERAVPAAALTFVPALLAVHYALPLARAVSWVARHVSRGRSDVVAAGLLAPLASAPEVTSAVPTASSSARRCRPWTSAGASRRRRWCSATAPT